MLLIPLNVLLIFSAASFAFYGLNCFTSKHMIKEFERYGIPQYRKLTGGLQLLGAFGLLIGFWIVYLQIISAIGLSLMMLMGVITRIMIKDALVQTLPAFLYCLLNAYLSIKLIATVL